MPSLDVENKKTTMTANEILLISFISSTKNNEVTNDFSKFHLIFSLMYHIKSK